MNCITRVIVTATLGIWRLHAATLDSSLSMESLPAIPLQGGTQNVKTNPVTLCYDFADRNGDGSFAAVTPAGNLSWNGDALGDGASGLFIVQNIDNAANNPSLNG